MCKTIAALSLGVFMLAACAEGGLIDGGRSGVSNIEGQEQELNRPSVLPADADLSVAPEAQLVFSPNWSHALHGTIYEGGELLVTVAPERFPTCGAHDDLRFFAMTDSGAIVEAALHSNVSWPSGSLVVPAGTRSIAAWMKSRSGDCVEYDSDFSRNYHFAVHAWEPTVVSFHDDWTHAVDGELRAGGVLVIDYDPARLPHCRGDFRDIPMWSMTAHVRFDDHVVQSGSVIDWETSHGIRIAAHRGLAVFPIPEGVSSAEIWFENDHRVPYPTVGICPAWDSDYGRNYRFEIR